jgi:hypothetical protein
MSDSLRDCKTKAEMMKAAKPKQELGEQRAEIPPAVLRGIWFLLSTFAKPRFGSLLF